MFDVCRIAVVIFLLMIAACSRPQPAPQDAADSAASEANKVFEDGFESGEDAGWAQQDTTEPQTDAEDQEANKGDDEAAVE